MGWAWLCDYEEVREDHPQGGRNQGCIPRSQGALCLGMKVRFMRKNMDEHDWKERFGQGPGGSRMPG